MALSFNTVKCPSCGADLQVGEGREKLFCSYCGSQIMITNENEHIYRQIDEAEIKRAETERIVRLRELDLEERRENQKNSLKNILTIIWIVLSLILLIIGLVIMFSDGGSELIFGVDFLMFIVAPVVGGGAYLIFKLIPEKENEKNLKENGGIKFPKDLAPFEEKHYEVIYNSLSAAGFTNVNCINMHDLKLGLLTKPGTVESVSVDGQKITNGGRIYMPDVPISILYHGK
ncbi:MAG: hypothetical protein ACI4KH_05245 [Oscillospiraceae bacterium]